LNGRGGSRDRLLLHGGGGPGAYAVWLAGLGCDVELVDPVELHPGGVVAGAAIGASPQLLAVGVKR
jgi:hypothetical protein